MTLDIQDRSPEVDSETEKPYDIHRLGQKLKQVVEHLSETARKQMNGIQKARFFGLLFFRLPTYAQLAGGTAGIPIITDVNPIFLPDFKSTFHLAGQTRIESPIAESHHQES